MYESSVDIIRERSSPFYFRFGNFFDFFYDSPNLFAYTHSVRYIPNYPLDLARSMHGYSMLMPL